MNEISNLKKGVWIYSSTLLFFILYYGLFVTIIESVLTITIKKHKISSIFVTEKGNWVKFFLNFIKFQFRVSICKIPFSLLKGIFFF